jgi:hypothetical protein
VVDAITKGKPPARQQVPPSPSAAYGHSHPPAKQRTAAASAGNTR